MIALLVTWVLSALCLYLTALIVPRFTIHSFPSALWAAVVIGFLNMVLRPILWFLTLPINIITLGLFTFVVNAVILKVAAKLLKGFDIEGWLPAILGAIVLAIVQSLILMVWGDVGYSMDPVPPESAV